MAMERVEGKLLGDDETILAHIEYLLASALASKPDLVIYWAESLARYLKKDTQTERSGERISNLLNSVKAAPVAMDVIPQPEALYTDEKLRQLATDGYTPIYESSGKVTGFGYDAYKDQRFNN